MNKFSIRLILSIISFLFVHTSYGQTWNKKTDFLGSKVYSPYCFSVDNKVFIGGGSLSSGNRTSDFYEYDPSTDKWTQKNAMPGGSMAEGVAFTINGKGYVGLGKVGTSISKSLWEYNPTTDKWTQKADLTYFSGVFRSKAFVVNNKAYILIGTSSNLVAQNDMYEFDPATNTWTQKANYPNNGRPDLPFAFAIGNKGYVSCGETIKAGGGGREFSKKTYEYDPSTDKWTPKADYLGDARYMGTAFVYNGKAYCGLGTYRDASFNNIYLDDFYVYDPISDSWSATTTYPGGKLRRGTVAIAGSNAYLGTGEGPGNSNNWYEFGLPLSVNDIIISGNNLSVHPNPSTGLISVNQKGVINKKYSINNMGGQVVSNGFIPSSKIIDARSLPVGSYILQVATNEGVLKTKIIIK